MNLEFFFSKKYNVLFNSVLFLLFVCLLPRRIKKLHSTLLMFGEGAIKQILMFKNWLYGFESAFWQGLFDFFFFVYLLFFFNHIKNGIPTGHNAFL